jgi:hypothetical protein
VAASRLDLEVPVAEACRAARRAVEGWGAELDGEEGAWTVHLPVIAGLRRGVVSGRLEIEPRGSGSTVSLIPGESHYSLHLASVVVLLFSGVGAVLSLLWPFRPDLLPLAPFGIVLALGGWFLVLSRLRNSGPEEFLKAVELELQPE